LPTPLFYGGKQLKIIKLLLISVIALFLLSGCGEITSNQELPSGRINVLFSAKKPTEDFSDRITVTFSNVKNAEDTFSFTLSRANEYSVKLSVPRGKYVLESCPFAKTGEEYCLDITELNLSKNEDYTVEADIVKTADLVVENESSFSAGIVIAVIVLVIIIYLSVTKVTKVNKNRNKRREE